MEFGWNDSMVLLMYFAAQYFATCYACIGSVVFKSMNNNGEIIGILSFCYGEKCIVATPTTWYIVENMF